MISQFIRPPYSNIQHRDYNACNLRKHQASVDDVSDDDELHPVFLEPGAKEQAVFVSPESSDSRDLAELSDLNQARPPTHTFDHQKSDQVGPMSLRHNMTQSQLPGNVSLPADQPSVSSTDIQNGADTSLTPTQLSTADPNSLAKVPAIEQARDDPLPPSKATTPDPSTEPMMKTPRAPQPVPNMNDMRRTLDDVQQHRKPEPSAPPMAEVPSPKVDAGHAREIAEQDGSVDNAMDLDPTDVSQWIPHWTVMKSVRRWFQ